jgi:hypothetical protein
MGSEEMPIVNTENQKPRQARALNVCGYQIPYWLIVVAVVLIAYLAYSKNLLPNLGGSSQVKLNLSNSVMQAASEVSTPEQIRNIIGRK